MSWLTLILGVVKLLGALSQWLHDQQQLDAGKAEQIAGALREQADALQKALAAREAVRADLARNPDGVMQDDGFRRD